MEVISLRGYKRKQETNSHWCLRAQVVNHKTKETAWLSCESGDGHVLLDTKSLPIKHPAATLSRSATKQGEMGEPPVKQRAKQAAAETKSQPTMGNGDQGAGSPVRTLKRQPTSPGAFVELPPQELRDVQEKLDRIACDFRMLRELAPLVHNSGIITGGGEHTEDSLALSKLVAGEASCDGQALDVHALDLAKMRPRVQQVLSRSVNQVWEKYAIEDETTPLKLFQNDERNPENQNPPEVIGCDEAFKGLAKFLPCA